MNNWDMIVSLLHPNGSCNKLLDTTARKQAWRAADGYGRMSDDQLTQLGLYEDWSHIRDSTTDGQDRIVSVLRIALCWESRKRFDAYPELGKDLQHYFRQVAEVVAKLGPLNR